MAGKNIVQASRKRKTVDRESPAADDPLQIGTSQLNLEAHSDDEEGQAESDDQVDDFPDVDFGDSDVSEEEFESVSENDEEETDYDDLDNEDEERIARELADEDESESDLDELVRRHTSKPDELEITPGTSWEDDALPVDFMKRSKTVKSAITGEEKTEWEGGIEPEYDSDSSTEETTNRIGNVPAYWYDDMPHIGYDVDGKRIMRPATGDELDKFLEGVEDADGGWTSVKDKLHGENVQLTGEELDLIQRLAKGENPDSSYDPYAPTIPWFTSQTMTMPLSGKPEPKRRFLPSKWEHKKVMKIVRAIRAGRIVPHKPKTDKPPFYGLWSNDDVPAAPHAMYMPAPKLALPGHAESYNPPEEYLWSKEEKEEFESKEPEEKKGQVEPQKFDSLRKVPAYKDFVQERFERCLDLYLAPRMLRRRPKLDIKDPSELIPKLPSPKDLRPFPTTTSITYMHSDGVRIRCTSIDPTGMWLTTGADDGIVRMWELAVGRCAAKWKCSDGPIYSVEWCPDRERSMFAVGSEEMVQLIAPTTFLSESLATRTSSFALNGFTSASTDEAGNAKKHEQPTDVHWTKPKSTSDRDEGRLVNITVPGGLRQITWHRKGDYFATVANDGGARSVLIHQLSKHQTQAPFKRQKSQVQRVAFHPTKPHFFVATQRNVRVYDLMAQSLVKTLNPGLKWISSLDVHPLGDNVIVGSYDKRLVWHDMDLASTPYKTLRYHTRALRSVAFSHTHPLFFSTSDDGSIHVFHATVYSDLLTNPLIVPLKVLKGHQINEGLGVLDAKWHPREPWIISVGADGQGRLWTV